MEPTIPRLSGEAPSKPDFLDDFVSETDYAARRGINLLTCQRDRQLRQAPPYLRFGRRVYYRIEAVREWLVKNERATDRLCVGAGHESVKSLHLLPRLSVSSSTKNIHPRQRCNAPASLLDPLLLRWRIFVPADWQGTDGYSSYRIALARVGSRKTNLSADPFEPAKSTRSRSFVREHLVGSPLPRSCAAQGG
jgi:hypothetical protein